MVNSCLIPCCSLFTHITWYLSLAVFPDLYGASCLELGLCIRSTCYFHPILLLPSYTSFSSHVHASGTTNKGHLCVFIRGNYSDQLVLWYWKKYPSLMLAAGCYTFHLSHISEASVNTESQFHAEYLAIRNPWLTFSVSFVLHVKVMVPDAPFGLAATLKASRSGNTSKKGQAGATLVRRESLLRRSFESAVIALIILWSEDCGGETSKGKERAEQVTEHIKVHASHELRQNEGNI